jgi:hypothetical protein
MLWIPKRSRMSLFVGIITGSKSSVHQVLGKLEEIRVEDFFCPFYLSYVGEGEEKEKKREKRKGKGREGERRETVIY